MQVFQDKEEETLVILVKLYQRQQNIQECITLSLATIAHLVDFLLIDYGGVIIFSVLIDYDGTVNPYSKAIDEISFIFGQYFLTVRIDNITWQILTKCQFHSIHIT